jgi:hypothetical protein
MLTISAMCEPPTDQTAGGGCKNAGTRGDDRAQSPHGTMRSRIAAHPWLAAATLAYVVVWALVGFLVDSPLALPYSLEMAAVSWLVLRLDLRHPFSTMTLAGLSLWGFLHMAGGMIPVGEANLYETWILPVLRWDQLVHAVGFGFAGVAMFEVYEPWLSENPAPRAAAWTAFLGASAIGALNEAIEFLASQVLPFANIGDEVNTGLDLIANTLGGLAAAWIVHRRTRTASPAQTRRRHRS